MTNLSGANLNNGAAVGPQGEVMDSPSTFPKYPAYKDSGVEWLGEVPKHWVVTKFSRHFSVRMGETIPETELSDEGWLPVYSATERDKFYGYVDERKPLVENGDLVIPARGNSIGFVKLVRASATATQTTIVANVLDHKITDSAYVYYWCLGLRRILFYFDRTAIPQITTEYVSRNPLLLPALAEQTQIARFLDHETARIDALIEEQQRLIELLKEKRQAVISHAVTKGLDPTVPMKDSGVEWLGEVPAHWVISQLKFNTLEMQTGPFGSQLHAEDYIDGGIPLVNPAHMINGKIIPDPQVSVDEVTWRRLKRHALNPGEIIFARRGELGRCAIVTNEQSGWLCGTGSLRARLSAKLDAEYAYLLITSKGAVAELSLESKGSTMENLNTETLGRIRLPLPSVSEQKAILEYVHEVSGQFEALVNAAESGISLITERRSALISAVVTGNIDVRGWRPATAKSTQHRKAVEA